MTKSFLVQLSLLGCLWLLNPVRVDAVSYAYDHLNRITQASINGGDIVIEYLHDAAGNQTATIVTKSPSIDSDGDGDPDITDSDDDNDGVSDADENTLGLHPYLNDSDGDGLLDGFEVQYAFNPLVVGESNQDPDLDGLINLEEQTIGTRPDKSDTDEDGVNDGDEVANGTDPLVNESLNTPTKVVPTLSSSNKLLLILLVSAIAIIFYRRRMYSN